MDRLAFMAPLRNQSVMLLRWWLCLTKEASIGPQLLPWWMNLPHDHMPSLPSSLSSIATIKKKRALFLQNFSLLTSLAPKEQRKQEQLAPHSRKESASTSVCLNSAMSSLLLLLRKNNRSSLPTETQNWQESYRIVLAETPILTWLPASARHNQIMRKVWTLWSTLAKQWTSRTSQWSIETRTQLLSILSNRRSRTFRMRMEDCMSCWRAKESLTQSHTKSQDPSTRNNSRLSVENIQYSKENTRKLSNNSKRKRKRRTKYKSKCMNSNVIVTCWLLFFSKSEPTILKFSSTLMKKACLSLKIISQKSSISKQKYCSVRRSTISCRLSIPNCGKVQKEINRFWPRRMKLSTVLQGRTKTWKKPSTSSEKKFIGSITYRNLITNLRMKACRSSTRH